MTTRTGLIIGKFYPPHLGHISLIERASRESDRLVVLVMATQIETVPLEQRVAWVTAATAQLKSVTVLGVLDDAPVHYESEIAWVAHLEVTEAALRNAGIDAVDVVFSSEDYGRELATRLGAAHVLDDPERRRIAMSGTAARENLAERWAQLVEPARLDLATRIIVIGAESTGTTTLAVALRNHYRAQPGFEAITEVDEYGRRFTYELHERAAADAAASGLPGPAIDDLVWLPEHFAHIAREQTRMEQAAALDCALVIADTDAFATSLWERRYVGAHSTEALRAATTELPRRDLYLITDHVGVPFDQDGWRDGEHIRPEMTRWIVDGLTARGLPWVLLRGSHRTRLDYSVEVIDALFARNSTFVSPSWADVTRLSGGEGP
ncbi:AAA family ATPase [Agreia pratensis]|uniref:AAA family ATPase n=1 Tax=Agreia pratensis TaxID=150121 RepID=UPI001889F0F0|nr:AAA family ATPase [Agreia pratensis]MBF4633961.1 AAA family ATPase [Agreia pratensis]